MSYLSHLESPVDGARFPTRTIQSTHLGRPLLARYHLESMRDSVRPEYLSDRPDSLWRYGELLPLAHSRHCVTLDERITALERQPELGRLLGLEDVWIKDETTLPTGSFKSRGMAVAISMARELGIRRVAIPTAGNAGAALAAYASAAGIEAYVFMPADAPVENQRQTAAGAKLFFVDGLITDCARFVQEGKEAAGWFDLSTLREPYRLEGKKTMGLEIAEQLGWRLPDTIIYPTGGGTGLIGMWKGFHELRRLGWLKNDAMPRMVAVQSDGCDPIVRAWSDGKEYASLFKDAWTMASGLRVPATIGDFLILNALRESEGCAVSVPEGSIAEWMTRGADTTGLRIGPESSTCLIAARQLAEEGWLSPSERVVIFNCGPERRSEGESAPDVPLLNPHGAIDWDLILAT
jgi:threonine synthase